jgi:hypothetical protein
VDVLKELWYRMSSNSNLTATAAAAAADDKYINTNYN